jgi:ribA/ribD-fused uncharacterized protein
MEKIDSFSGPYEFLSNYYFCVVYLDEERYYSVEHAYQAAKTLNKDERKVIRNVSSPDKAKKLGKKCTIRKDWESIKLQVMYCLLKQKFAHPELKELLLSTWNAELIEGNWWKDTFWGVYNGKGSNHLGRLLMKVRDELKLERENGSKETSTPNPSL